MKKLLFLILLGFIFPSCNPENKNDTKDTFTNTEELIGVWQWTNTDGGIGSNIQETPKTTKKTVQLIISEESRLDINENGYLYYKGNFSLSMKKSIYSGEKETYLSFSSTYENNKIVLNGIISIDTNGDLIIADNIIDGVASTFIQVEK